MNKLLTLLKSFIRQDQPDPDDVYLASATDIYDLERRMRDIDSRGRIASLYPIVSHG